MKDIAKELISIAKDLSASEVKAADHDKALSMIKGSEQISKQIKKLAEAVDKEFESARKDIEGLEKVGSAGIEAPKLLGQVQQKIAALNDYLKKAEDAIKKAI